MADASNTQQTTTSTTSSPQPAAKITIEPAAAAGQPPRQPSLDERIAAAVTAALDARDRPPAATQRPPASAAPVPWYQSPARAAAGSAVGLFMVVAAMLMFSWGMEALNGRKQVADTASPPASAVADVSPPAPAAPAVKAPPSPFIAAAPPGHSFVGATRGASSASCEARGGEILPDLSKPIEKTAKGYRRPNKCSLD